jgi:hypothetical protein
MKNNGHETEKGANFCVTGERHEFHELQLTEKAGAFITNGHEETRMGKGEASV